MQNEYLFLRRQFKKYGKRRKRCQIHIYLLKMAIKNDGKHAKKKRCQINTYLLKVAIKEI